MQELSHFNSGLLDFLQRATTPFHAVAAMSADLEEAGFKRLQEGDAWQLQPGRYYCVRNGSTLCAFVLGRERPEESGWRMVGAHTDSPCLKVKPQPDLYTQGYWQLGVEVYGGVLLNPWFDRDLSLAGRVSYRREDGDVASALVDFKKPLAVVPSLAIHLDREANNSRSINPQKDLPPVLMRVSGEVKPQLRALLMEQLKHEQPELSVAEVLDYELSFYDHQSPALVGLEQEFIASARLDNLLSCFVGLQALLSADGEHSCLLVCNDHEEVGSQSAAGAQGPMLRNLLQRVAGDTESYVRAIDRSLMISCDNAHALHPNYADRHDGNHGPQLNAGPVIKINANQRYATNSETSALFRRFCHEAEAPVQSFVVRTDMACGSTIGPISAGNLGVATVDVGVPQWAMHSIREMCGAYDPHHLYRALAVFNQSYSVVCAD